MADKVALFQLGDAAVSVLVGTVIKREALYGKEVRSIEKDGQVLQPVLLDPEGNLYAASAFARLSCDSEGSVATTPIVQTLDGETLEPNLSAFEERRALAPADIEDVLRLRVSSVMPVVCDLPVGFYRTEFAYKKTSQPLHDAILNITPEGGFLLTGTFIDTPMSGPSDLYNFFDEDPEESEEGDEQDDDDMSLDFSL